MPSLAISSWSLHETLGPTYPGIAVSDTPRTPAYPYGTAGLELLALPAALAAQGFTQVELCHFHFPRTDSAYLQTLCARFREAGITLTTLLIDEGDITATDPLERADNLTAISAWIDVAAAIGMRRVRIIAGDAAPESPTAIPQSVAGLGQLAAYGQERGIAVITENWRRLGDDPDSLLAILDTLAGQVGLCADFGNIPPAERRATLQRLLPRAQTIHAKAEYFADGTLDSTDFLQNLALARDAHFAGEYVLIYGDGGNEWEQLRHLATLVAEYL